MASITVTIMTNGDKVYRFYPRSTGGSAMRGGRRAFRPRFHPR